MDASPRCSQVDIAPPPYKKNVHFDNVPPEVRVIEAGMETWRNGERADETSDEDEANADTLWRETYALASAQEEQDAADYFSTTHTTHVQPSRKKPARLATPCPQPLHRHLADTTNHMHRKPVPVRAQTMPPRVDSPFQDMSYHGASNQPRYERTLTDHSFDNFLDTKELGHTDKDMRDRRASLHPFEHLATLALRKAKKEGSKAVAFVEEKIREQQSKRR
jgi:hypothetical protein